MKKILVTTGEPAGIGPDIVLQIAKYHWDADITVISAYDLLAERAKQLKINIALHRCDINDVPRAHQVGSLNVIDIPLIVPCTAGKLNTRNAMHVLTCLEKAAQYCLEKKATALVTGPVQKSNLLKAGIEFYGHTEFFEKQSHVKKTVMLFLWETTKIALATTHIPLSQVPKKITRTHLEHTILILHDALQKQFQIKKPMIAVCGLNPHAGENGYLGQEESDIIIPILSALRKKNFDLIGPLPADTALTPFYLKKSHATLAMYHDQGLPVVKALGFGHAVNMTLGLPFIRTSVDHGTALDMAGTGKANSDSLKKAIEVALQC